MVKALHVRVFGVPFVLVHGCHWGGPQAVSFGRRNPRVTAVHCTQTLLEDKIHSTDDGHSVKERGFLDSNGHNNKTTYVSSSTPRLTSTQTWVRKSYICMAGSCRRCVQNVDGHLAFWCEHWSPLIEFNRPGG
ncbi:hypothetical protein PAXINDRAFT_170118, partial [Paxillus involutus ATCC 200175]